MTVEELSERMSAAEFSWWQAFYQLEPFGEEWRQTATICARVGNSAGGKGKGVPFTIWDTMPVKEYRPPQTGEQILSIFKSLAAR